MRYEFEEMEREWIDNPVIFKGATDAQVRYSMIDPRPILKVGEKYEVADCTVYSCSTDIYLKDFPGVAFNSVWFEVAEKESPIHQIIREMKTNSGKFALRSVMHKDPEKIVKKKKRLIRDFGFFDCVKVDIEEAISKLELTIDSPVRFLVLSDGGDAEGFFSNKEEVKGYISRLIRQRPGHAFRFEVFKKVSVNL